MPVEPQGQFKYWRDPLFLLGLAIYVANRLVMKPIFGHASAFIHGHLNDCLTVPVALPIYLYVYRLIGFRPDDFAPRWWEVALHAIVWMIFFEWFGPVVLQHGTYDPIDDWCIGVGGFIAWLIWAALESYSRSAARPEF